MGVDVTCTVPDSTNSGKAGNVMASLVVGLAGVTVAASTLGKRPVPAIEADMSHITCKYCKEYGHNKWFCPKLNKKSKEKDMAPVMGLGDIQCTTAIHYFLSP